MNFLWWMLHDGQKEAPTLHYAPLPKGLIKRVDDKLAAIKVGK